MTLELSSTKSIASVVAAIQARVVRIERVVSRYASWMMKNPARSAKPKMPITRNAEMSNAKRFPLGEVTAKSQIMFVPLVVLHIASVNGQYAVNAVQQR